jgi:hypothetical protein
MYRFLALPLALAVAFGASFNVASAELTQLVTFAFTVPVNVTNAIPNAQMKGIGGYEIGCAIGPSNVNVTVADGLVMSFKNAWGSKITQASFPTPSAAGSESLQVSVPVTANVPVFPEVPGGGALNTHTATYVCMIHDMPTGHLGLLSPKNFSDETITGVVTLPE